MACCAHTTAGSLPPAATPTTNDGPCRPPGPCGTPSRRSGSAGTPRPTASSAVRGGSGGAGPTGPRVGPPHRRAAAPPSARCAHSASPTHPRPARDRHAAPCPDRPAPDLVDRGFAADAPNRCRAGDFTHVKTRAGVVRVASVVNTFSRSIAGRPAATVEETVFAPDAPEGALRQHPDGESDRPVRGRTGQARPAGEDAVLCRARHRRTRRPVRPPATPRWGRPRPTGRVRERPLPRNRGTPGRTRRPRSPSNPERLDEGDG